MKKYIKNYLKLIIELLVGTMLLSFLLFMNIIGNNTYSYMELILILLVLYLNASKMVRGVSKYFVIEGIKQGLFFIILFTIINIILKNEFNLRLIIYYLLILFISMLGSMKKKV